jgi:basic membrane protein A
MAGQDVLVVLIVAGVLFVLICLIMTESNGQQSSQNPLQVALAADLGGINDRAFNMLAWEGMLNAQVRLGVQVQYLEAKTPSEYRPHIETFIQKGIPLIIVMGQSQQEVTEELARQYPEQKFIIVDTTSSLPNVQGISFRIEEASMLAGYLAAGMTKTGVVGTFGGMQIPSVVAFMNGFAEGINYYNQRHGTSVRLLGWNPEAQQGIFVGNFTDLQQGYYIGQAMIQQGADIILPVAGNIGYGTAEAIRGKGLIIGVDSDWGIYPEVRDVTLTSVLKNIDQEIYRDIADFQNGQFQGGNRSVGLYHGVGLAPFHQFESQVPMALKCELERLRGEIICSALQRGYS